METSREHRTLNKNRNIYPKSFSHCNPKDINDVLSDTQTRDWVIVSNSEKESKMIEQHFSHFIINPGCLYIYKNAYLFNINAHSIRDKEISDIEFLKSLYPSSKIIILENLPQLYDVYDEDYLKQKIQTKSYQEKISDLAKNLKKEKIYIINDTNLELKFNKNAFNITDNILDTKKLLIFSENLLCTINKIEQKYNLNITEYEIFNMFEDTIKQEYYYNILRKNNFQQQLETIKNKYADKRIIIYGAGVLFNVINQYYKFENLNIIAITDKKFNENISDSKTCYQYTCITPDKLKTVDFDLLLVTTVSLRDKVKNLKTELQLKPKTVCEFCYKEI